MTRTIGNFGRSSRCLRNALGWVGRLSIRAHRSRKFSRSKGLNATNFLGNRVVEGAWVAMARDKAAKGFLHYP